MGDIHRAYFNGHKGYVNIKTGRVRFESKVYPNIEMAIKYLRKK
jgi:hypothetical protein